MARTKKTSEPTQHFPVAVPSSQTTAEATAERIPWLEQIRTATPVHHMPGQLRVSMPARDLGLALKAALLWANHDTTRPHINTVHFEPRGDGKAIYIVSSDGHGAYVCEIDSMRLDTRFSDTFKVHSIEALLTALKPYMARGKNAPIGTAYIEGNTARVESSIDGTVVHVPLQGLANDDSLMYKEGYFPPWRRIIPSEWSRKRGFDTTSWLFHGPYLAKLPDTFCSGSKSNGVLLDFWGELDPLVAHGSTVNPSARDAFVLLMPMRK